METEDPFAQADNEAATGADDDDLPDTLDLSDVDEISGRETVPVGTYDAFVETVEYKKSARSGNAMFAWRLRLRLPDSDEYTYSLYYHTTFSAKDIGRTKHAVNVALNGEVDWGNFRPTDVAEALGGCYIRAKVGIQNSPEYGKSNTVREILPPAEASGGFAN